MKNSNGIILHEPSVLCGESVLKHLQSFVEKCSSRIFILMDDNTFRHAYSVLVQNVPALEKSPYIVVSSGDQHKNLAACEKIWSYLLQMQAGREDILINCGGGVICDLGSFSASVYKRGISYINIPTSLLAMADASFGGKTGINFNNVKNLIGSFKEPLHVYIDPIFLQTLPSLHIKNGMAEIIKHAVIAGGKLWNDIVSLESTKPFPVSILQQCIHVKLKITQKDMYDTGERKTLNYGHTIGHAIESASLATEFPMLHGESVALGMIAENMLAEKFCGFKEQSSVVSLLQKHCRLLYNPSLSFEQISRFILHDKKAKQNKLLFSLPEKPGSILTDISVDIESIENSFQEMMRLLNDMTQHENKS